MRQRRFARNDEAAELNIMPLMNIVMLLIPFLLISSQFIKIGVLNAAAPGTDPDGYLQPGPTPPKVLKPLLLTVAVTPKGFTVMTRKGRLKPNCQEKDSSSQGATFPRVAGKYPFKALRTCMKTIKKLHPHENKVILMVSPKIPYQAVVSTMDTTRDDGQGKLLFPRVAFSAGVQ